MKKFASGALSSEESPRYDLIPLASLKRQAARMALGAKTHGAFNYRKGAADPEFIRDRVNHLLGHAIAFASGDSSDDHLGAVLANAGMLADLEDLALTHDDRLLASQPCPACQTPTFPPGPCVGCRRAKGATPKRFLTSRRDR